MINSQDQLRRYAMMVPLMILLGHIHLSGLGFYVLSGLEGGAAVYLGEN